jgi:competence protein ComFC
VDGNCLKDNLKTIFMNLLDFIFPKRCVGCGKLGRYFCERCTSTIRIIESNEAICPVCEKPAIDGATHPRCKTKYSIDGLTSFFRYDGVVKKAVKAIKYRFISDLASEFISLIPDQGFDGELSRTARNNNVIVSIPLHSSRKRARGFNQAEVLGAILAKQLNIPIRTDILRRERSTTPQVEMKDRNKRLQNMEKVFSIHNSQFNIHHSTIVLFDDVFTTGATMRSAANILKRAGAKRVWAVTMAR